MEGYFFDEQKRARRGTSKNFYLLSGSLSVVVGLIFGFFTFSQFTYADFSPLQKFYFGQFAKSFINQPNLIRKSDYRILMYQAINPRTKKKDWFASSEDQMMAKIDENGNVLLDEKKTPMFFLKNEVPYEKNSFMFFPEKMEHKWVHNFLSQTVYKADFFEFFYPAAGSAIFSSVFLFAGMGLFRKRRFKKILEGKYLRGTRLLSPEQYNNEMKDADGLAINILTVR